MLNKSSETWPNTKMMHTLLHGKSIDDTSTESRFTLQTQKSINLSLAYTDGSWLLSPRKQSLSSENEPHTGTSRTTSLPTCSSPLNSGTDNFTLTWHCYEDDTKPAAPVKLTFFNESQKEVALNCRIKANGKNPRNVSKCVSFSVKPTLLSIPPAGSADLSVLLVTWNMREITEQYLIVEIDNFNSKTQTKEEITMSLTVYVLPPPVVQVDQTCIDWFYGGSSRMLRLRNGGCDPYLVHSTILQCTGQQNGADVQTKGRFELRSKVSEIVLPGEYVALWIMCSPDASLAQARLLLHATPEDIARGTTNVVSELEQCSRFPPRLFEVLLKVGNCDDVESLTIIGNDKPRLGASFQQRKYTKKHEPSGCSSHFLLGANPAMHVNCNIYQHTLVSEKAERLPEGKHVDKTRNGSKLGH